MLTSHFESLKTHEGETQDRDDKEQSIKDFNARLYFQIFAIDIS